MTTIAPPAPTIRPRTRTSRSVIAVRQAVLTVWGMAALALPAHLTLRDAPTTSGVIAAATAFGVAALLNLVLASAIWRLLRGQLPWLGLAGTLSLIAASTTALYASLALIWHGTPFLASFADLLGIAATFTAMGLLAALAGVTATRVTSARVTGQRLRS